MSVLVFETKQELPAAWHLLDVLAGSLLVSNLGALCKEITLVRGHPQWEITLPFPPGKRRGCPEWTHCNPTIRDHNIHLRADEVDSRNKAKHGTRHQKAIETSARLLPLSGPFHLLNDGSGLCPYGILHKRCS